MSGRPLPWSEACFVCGEGNSNGLRARFHADGEEVRARVVLDRCFEGYPGHVHGGVVTALLDEAAGWACTVAVGRLCVTVELTVRFLRPVPGGEELGVRARCTEAGGRRPAGEAWLEDGRGRRLAHARGRFVPVPEERHRAVVASLRMPGRAARVEDL